MRLALKLKKKNGYVLAWILCFILVASVLAAAATTVTIVAINNTKTQKSSRQAYYTARSAVAAVVNHIRKNPSPEAIEALIGREGTGGSDELGRYTVTVSYVAPQKLRVSATATYGERTSTVSAYMLEYVPPAGAKPTDHIIYVDGSAEVDFDNANVYGDVYINGGVRYGSSMTIYGDVIVTGDSTISGAGTASQDLISFGSVVITAGGKINGDLKAKGDISLSGGVIISGGLYTDNSLNFTGGGYVEGDAVVGKNVHFSGGANRILGKLFYGGRATVGNNNLAYFCPGGYEKITDYQDMDLSAYAPAVLPPVSVPSQTENPELYRPVQIINKVISSSGDLTPAVDTLENLKWTTLTMDTRDGDLHLLLNNKSLKFTGLSINIIGDNNIYLYLKGDSAYLGLEQGHFRPADATRPPQLFILGSGDTEVYLKGTQLHAFVYMPSGTMGCYDYQKDDAIFKGSSVVKHIRVGNYLTLKYIEPVLTGTPLENYFNPDGGGAGVGGWSVEGWDSR